MAPLSWETDCIVINSEDTMVGQNDQEFRFGDVGIGAASDSSAWRCAGGWERLSSAQESSFGWKSRFHSAAVLCF